MHLGDLAEWGHLERQVLYDLMLMKMSNVCKSLNKSAKKTGSLQLVRELKSKED